MKAPISDAEALLTGMVVGLLSAFAPPNHSPIDITAVSPVVDDGCDYTNKVRVTLGSGTEVIVTVEEVRSRNVRTGEGDG